MKQFNKREVRLIQVDAGVCSDEVVEAKALNKIRFVGGGGTDMRPLFEHLKKDRGTNKRTPLILWTDGCWFGEVDWTGVKRQVLVLLNEGGTDSCIAGAGKNVRCVRIIPLKKDKTS